MVKAVVTTVFAALLASQTGTVRHLPARFVDGPLPPVPVGALGGGEVLLEAHVATDGRVTAVTTLRTTPPFAIPLINAVWRWRFQPATDAAGTPTVSTVLVGAFYRPPAIIGPTLGHPPTDVERPSATLPFPEATVTPTFPPAAAAAGTVLVEAEIDASGRPDVLTIVRGAPPFTESALAAAKGWRFRPGRVDGAPTRSVAYLVFGFPVPVVATAPVPAW